MKVHSCIQSIDSTIKEYLLLLKNADPERFSEKPPSGGWSCSEIYCHVVQVNMRSLFSIEKCIYHKASGKPASKSWIARLILSIGRFPPGKIKAPPSIEAIVCDITIEDARNELNRFSNKFKDILPRLHKAPSDAQAFHTRLGMLNCYEWLRFIDIHSRHHLKQVRRRMGK